MSTMKEFYEKYLAELQEIQEADTEPNEEHIQELILAGFCFSYLSPRTLKRREILGELIRESYHCVDCGVNWNVDKDPLTQTVTWYVTETNWVDQWNQQDDD